MSEANSTNYIYKQTSPAPKMVEVEVESKPKPKPNLLIMKPQIPVLKISISFSISVILLFSVFIILSLSFFHLSPNYNFTLLKNTKFWFFISNIIVVVVAADSGVFSSSSSSSKLENDLYEEFMKKCKAKTTSTTSFTKAVPYNQADGSNATYLEKEPIIQSDDQSAIFFESKTTGPKIPSMTNSETSTIQEKEIFEARYHRCNSEKTISVVVDEDNKQRIFCRCESEKPESRFEEENEFSCMSDEELNKRVEEFIDRFKKQIRLQEEQKL